MKDNDSIYNITVGSIKRQAREVLGRDFTEQELESATKMYPDMLESMVEDNFREMIQIIVDETVEENKL